MSEQSQSPQSSHPYDRLSRDGFADMTAETDIWLKASKLPTKSQLPERQRSKTEAEIQAERVRRAATELANLNVVRRYAQGIESSVDQAA